MRHLKHLVALVIVAACCINLSTAQEKMSKKERKRLEKKWKKEAKQYKKDPLSLKKKFERYEESIDELKEEKAAMQKQVSELESENSMLEDSISTLLAKYQKRSGQSAKQTMDGLIMKVQIGAYNNFDASASFNEEKHLAVERDGQLKRYRIGNFVNLPEAKALVTDIQKMGIKDAWVVPFLDGEQITMEELEDMLANKNKRP